MKIAKNRYRNNESFIFEFNDKKLKRFRVEILI